MTNEFVKEAVEKMCSIHGSRLFETTTQIRLLNGLQDKYRDMITPDDANEILDLAIEEQQSKEDAKTTKLLECVDMFEQKGTVVKTIVDFLETYFAKEIDSKVFIKINDLMEKCKEKKKRKLTARDFAVAYYVHRMHVTKNEDHSSCFIGIVNYTIKCQKTKSLITFPLTTYHVSLIMNIFKALRLTVETHPKCQATHKAARYKMIENYDLDTVWEKMAILTQK